MTDVWKAMQWERLLDKKAVELWRSEVIDASAQTPDEVAQQVLQ